MPFIGLVTTGATWRAEPVGDRIDELSNNGFGYTGEIDRFAIVAPETGRLQIVLTWESETDLDLFVAEDEQGHVRLAEGVIGGFDPEMVKVPVIAGQRIFVFVAGWEGEGADYELETLLLPDTLPPFELVAGPAGDETLPRNFPLAFSFSEELAPDQEVAELVHFYGAARAAPGEWCVLGEMIIFHPRLPERPGDEDVLLEGSEYLLQFPRASRGLRSIHGEFLDEVVGGAFSFEGWGVAGDGPPRVLSHTVLDGGAIEVEISRALDPETIRGHFEVNGVPVPTEARLLQSHSCGEPVRVRLEYRPVAPLPARFSLVLPGSILSLPGDAGLTGPAPAPPGAGTRLDFGG